MKDKTLVKKIIIKQRINKYGLVLIRKFGVSNRNKNKLRKSGYKTENNSERTAVFVYIVFFRVCKHQKLSWKFPMRK